MSSNGFEQEQRLYAFAVQHGDSTIFSHLQNGRKYGDTIQETMEKIIYALGKEKQDIMAAYQFQLNTNPRRDKRNDT